MRTSCALAVPQRCEDFGAGRDLRKRGGGDCGSEDGAHLVRQRLDRGGGGVGCCRSRGSHAFRRHLLHLGLGFAQHRLDRRVGGVRLAARRRRGRVLLAVLSIVPVQLSVQHALVGRVRVLCVRVPGPWSVAAGCEGSRRAWRPTVDDVRRSNGLMRSSSGCGTAAACSLASARATDLGHGSGRSLAHEGAGWDRGKDAGWGRGAGAGWGWGEGAGGGRGTGREQREGACQSRGEGAGWGRGEGREESEDTGVDRTTGSTPHRRPERPEYQRPHARGPLYLPPHPSRPLCPLAPCPLSPLSPLSPPALSPRASLAYLAPLAPSPLSPHALSRPLALSRPMPSPFLCRLLTAMRVRRLRRTRAARRLCSPRPLRPPSALRPTSTTRRPCFFLQPQCRKFEVKFWKKTIKKRDGEEFTNGSKV